MPDIESLLVAKQERIDRLHRCQPGRTALLVIDMQRGFLEPGAALEVPPGREVVPRVAQLIATCRRYRVPVVFTQFIYSPTVPCLRGEPFGPEHLPAQAGAETGFGLPSSNCLIETTGPNSADIVPELAPRPDELVVAAHTYDKFLGTPLDLTLRARDIRWLIVTGVVTDICVQSTVLTAANLDYRVTVATDGVATLWPEIQEACFHIWRRKFARLRTTAELVAEIEQFA